MKVIDIINSEYFSILMEGYNKVLYHGTNKDELDISNKEIWLAEDREYAELWGRNIFEVVVKLGNTLDVYNDLGKKRFSLKQHIKYLNSKGVDTSEFLFVIGEDINTKDKYSFWNILAGDYSSKYSWLSTDIFNSGYDSISIDEYGYRYSQNCRTYLINNPIDKVISINKIN